jgi:peptidoglycan/LPS O-acetylase OafA/YrhL
MLHIKINFNTAEQKITAMEKDTQCNIYTSKPRKLFKMGTLRTLFAIAVVFAHSFGNLLVGGRNAVQLFYMISGFLISFVLVERNAYPDVKSFYINRYLRIYPIYLVIATLTLIAFILASTMGKDINF